MNRDLNETVREQLVHLLDEEHLVMVYKDCVVVTRISTGQTAYFYPVEVFAQFPVLSKLPVKRWCSGFLGHIEKCFDEGETGFTVPEDLESVRAQNSAPRFRGQGRFIERYDAYGAVDRLGTVTTPKLAEAGARFWTILPANPNLEQAMLAWLEAYVELRLNNGSTVREYRDVTQFVIVPRLGQADPVSLNTKDIEALRKDLIASGMTSKRVTVVLRTLSAFYGKAKSWGLVKTNPVVGVNHGGIGMAP